MNIYEPCDAAVTANQHSQMMTRRHILRHSSSLVFMTSWPKAVFYVFVGISPTFILAFQKTKVTRH